ncbi:LacI family transcriptional regulator [bacterium]|nr:LacI family transcriptional regulator [bacterium]
MAPTIRDVAKRANVAPSTVSAVLNSKGYIHPDTFARVQKAIRDLEYTPRRSARNLTQQVSGNIGFIVHDAHFNQAEPFYTRVFLGAELKAREYDLYVLLSTVPERYSARNDLPRFLLEHNVDGIIIAGSVPRKVILDVLNYKLPMVLVDFGDDEMNVSRVLIENRLGTKRATQHLIEQGIENIGYIGASDGHPSERERFSGFTEAINEAGVPLHADWIDHEEKDTRTENGIVAFERMWNRGARPRGMVCFNDAIALGVMRAADRLGVHVPDDLAVVGFDDVEVAGLVSPSLSTVRVFKEELGVAAVQTITDMIDHPDRKPVTSRVGVEFVARKSSFVNHLIRNTSDET